MANKNKKQYSAAEKKSFKQGLFTGLRIGKGKKSNGDRRVFHNRKSSEK